MPGATPKKPNSGLTAYSCPSSPKRIQAMSSPRVSARHPGGMVGWIIARLVLPQAEGECRRDVVGLVLGRDELEDEHVLGQPASSCAIAEAIRSE